MEQALREALRERVYLLDVAEEREALVQAVHKRLPAADLAAVYTYVRRWHQDAQDGRTLEEGTPQATAAPAAGDDGAASDGQEELNEREREIEEVLCRLDGHIVDLLKSGQFLATSSERNGEYYCCVALEYSAVVARDVERDIQHIYCRQHAEALPIQPYFHSLYRYNQNRPDDWQRKEMVLTAMFFQWLQDPRTVPPALRRPPPPPPLPTVAGDVTVQLPGPDSGGVDQ